MDEISFFAMYYRSCCNINITDVKAAFTAFTVSMLPDSPQKFECQIKMSKLSKKYLLLLVIAKTIW